MSPFTWNRKKFKIVKVGNPVLENVKNSFLQIPKKAISNFIYFLAENPLTYGLLESKKKSPEMQFWIGQNVFQKFWQPCQITYFPFSRLILHLDWWNLGIKHVLDVEREWHSSLSSMTPHSPNRVANFLKKNLKKISISNAISQSNLVSFVNNRDKL